MTAVKWLEVHIDTNHTGLEPVETMLSALGIDGVVIDDETEFEDFLENNRQRPGGAEKDPGRLRHPADDPG